METADFGLGKFEKVLGSYHIKQLSDPSHAVFHDGARSFTSWQLAADFGIGSGRAAANLSKAMKRLGYKSLFQLFQVPPDDLAKMRNVGLMTVTVLLKIAEARGLNTAKWEKGEYTWNTLKRHMEKEERPNKRRRSYIGRHGRRKLALAG